MSDEELKKHIEIYNSVKDKKNQHKNKLRYGLEQEKYRWIKTKGRELFLVMDNAKYNRGKLFKEHLEKIRQEKGFKI